MHTSFLNEEANDPAVRGRPPTELNGKGWHIHSPRWQIVTMRSRGHEILGAWFRISFFFLFLFDRSEPRELGDPAWETLHRSVTPKDRRTRPKAQSLLALHVCFTEIAFIFPAFHKTVRSFGVAANGLGLRTLACAAAASCANLGWYYTGPVEIMVRCLLR
jgi:hypothetical protein